MARVFGVFGLLLLLAGPLEAGFVNGSFEQGLSGWTPSDIGVVSSVSSYTSSSSVGTTYVPEDGSFFAVLEANDVPDVYTTLKQTFVASEGQTLSGKVFFRANDTFNDDSYVRILNEQGVTVESGLLFSKNVSEVGGFGSTPWTSFSYMFTTGGIYTIEAGVRNVGEDEVDPGYDSVLGLDEVQLSPEAVPEPASLIIWSLAATGLILLRRVRRPKSELAS